MAKATIALPLLLLSGVSSFTPSSSLAQSRLKQQKYTNTIQQSFPTTTISSRHNRYHTRKTSLESTPNKSNSNDVEGMLNDEIPTTINSNWMKRSASIDFMPAEMTNSNSGTDDESVYMDAGINGQSFGTGELSLRMHEALMKVATSKFPNGNIPEELSDVYMLYSMDASAKEAVKVAMDSNGYTLNLGEEEAMQDEGAWGQIDQVMLLDSATNEPTKGEDGASSYTSLMEAISKGGWEPGEGYSFIVREVPSRKKAMDLEALLKAMDPDGTLWDEAKEKGMLMPGDEVESLSELGGDCEQRVKTAPVEATNEFEAFRGGTSKGYNVISRGELLKGGMNEDGTENQRTLLHVMDSLANHGCLIVDMTDGDTTSADATKMSNMWETTTNFFDKITNDETVANSILPPMQQAEGVGSSHAMVGYASFKDGDNQFMETRIRRSDGKLLPEETSSIVGEDGSQSMVDAFNVMSQIGKDIVRIVTAASSVEADAFLTVGSVVSQEEEGSPSIAGLSFEEATVSGIAEEEGDASEEDMVRAEILASEAAILLTEEIMDDGKPLAGGEIEHDEGPVSMSPHRMCRYSNNNKSSRRKKASEIFGAHTDTSFVTIVPAAKVSGLEVFDEDSLQWYRPELNARKHAKTLDPKGNMDEQFPWHARYLIVMPGELLQLTSRNNVPAAVHRVVVATDAPRLSAPVLLRARPGTKMDVERYMGSLENADGLLLESNGMKMEAIHDALQPSSKQ